MRKRILSLVLCIVMLVGILPVGVLADDEAVIIYVGGNPMEQGQYMDTEGNITDTAPEGGYAHYADGTLTLNGFTYTGPGYLYDSEYTALVYSQPDLTVQLVGENAITNTYENIRYGDGIATGGNLTIQGEGSLTIGAHGDALYATNLFIDSGSVIIQSEGYGAKVGTMSVSGGTLDITSTYTALYVRKGNMSITGGEVVVNTGGYGIYVPVGKIEVTGGYTDVAAENIAIYTDGGNITMGGDAEVIAKAKDALGVYCWAIYSISGDVIIKENAVVAAVGESANSSYGIFAEQDSVEISGGQVSCQGETAAVKSGYKITLTGMETEGVELSEDGTTIPGPSVTIKAEEDQQPEEPEELPCDGTGDCPSAGFYDLDTTEWYHPYIDNVISGNLMEGTDNGIFDPHASVTRAMAVTILWRLQGTPSAAYTAVFADVPADQWYTEAICWAVKNKIVAGYGNGTFGPDDEMTREQLATVLFRFARYNGYTTCIKGKLSSFSDAKQVSYWAENAILWAEGYGILEGRADGTLDPKGNAQRCEVAKMLAVFQQKVIPPVY